MLGMAVEQKNFQNMGKDEPPSPNSPFQWNFPLDTASVLRCVNGAECSFDHRRPNHIGPTHHHSASDTAIIEEQPAWLDELLNEQETPAFKGHRRSFSDSVAYLESNNFAVGVCGESQNFIYSGNLQHTSFGKNPSSVNKKKSVSFDEPSKTTGKQDEEGGEGFSSKNDCSSTKHSTSKTESKESKRTKQQMAHRSRVRKLRYIADLERSVQTLQVQGAEAFAQLVYFDHHMLLLDMENKALKQRMENLSQEQLMKHLEQTMLAREIGRLQLIYQQQQQQKQHQQKQKNHQSSNRGPVFVGANS